MWRNGLFSLSAAFRFRRIIGLCESTAACRLVSMLHRLATQRQGNGKRAAYAFYRRGVAAEKYDDRYVVFILTPYDGEEGLGALAEAAECVLGRGI